MPFLNFENRHFSPQEVTAINDAIGSLQSILVDKLATLTSDERQRYGSINEQNKLLVNKVKDYRDSQPKLSSPDVDWDEFMKDYNSRNLLQLLTEQLVELTRGLENAKILHDWDNYQASLIDYQYTGYRNDAGSPGFHTKNQEIKQFFNRSGSGGSTNTTDGNPS